MADDADDLSRESNDNFYRDDDVNESSESPDNHVVDDDVVPVQDQDNPTARGHGRECTGHAAGHGAGCVGE